MYNGERRSKADDTFDVLGHQDELNAAVGVAAEYCMLSSNGLEEKYELEFLFFICNHHVDMFRLYHRIRDIQSRLFDLGAAVATPRLESSESKVEYTKVNFFIFASIHH